MKVNTNPYKGSRDFYPEDKRIQKWMFAKWRRVAEKYGYEEYDSPIIEPTDLFLMKGNEEIIKEQTYTFSDRGGRSVTIRTEMTPSVSRMIAGRRQELAYPARWYSIPNLWRYERMQKGRLREFWQLNVDMFGVNSIQAEIEMLKIIDDLFQAFKANRKNYVIKVNSRVLVNTSFEFFCGLNEEQTLKMVRLTDKKDKMKSSEFEEEVNKITNNKDRTKLVINLLNTKKIDDLPSSIKGSPSVRELTTLLSNVQKSGVRNVEFDITLMRGFDYYTDIVFEVFDTGNENNRSILGGGRYDGLVGQFGVEPIPTIGFAVGDVIFKDFLETYKLIPKLTNELDVIMIVRSADAVLGASKAADELREMGANVAVDYSERKVDKQFKTALKTDVKFAIFVGEEEIKSGLFILKDLKNGKEQKHSLQRVVSIIKDSRKR